MNQEVTGGKVRWRRCERESEGEGESVRESKGGRKVEGGSKKKEVRKRWEGSEAKGKEG